VLSAASARAWCQFGSLPWVAEINRLVCHGPQDVSCHWRVVGLGGELDRGREVMQGEGVLGVIE
jgi:hypothetical protein